MSMSKCVYCGCTDEMACPDGCAWLILISEDRGVCSACAGKARISDFQFKRMLRAASKMVLGKRKSGIVGVHAKDLLALLAARAAIEDATALEALVKKETSNVRSGKKTHAIITPTTTTRRVAMEARA